MAAPVATAGMSAQVCWLWAEPVPSICSGVVAVSHALGCAACCSCQQLQSYCRAAVGETAAAPAYTSGTLCLAANWGYLAV